MIYYSQGVIYLVEFCKCGSLILNGHCSNKGCAFVNKDSVSVAASHKKTRTKTKSTTKSSIKSSNPRMSSKCITYNLYEINENEKDNAID